MLDFLLAVWGPQPQTAQPKVQKVVALICLATLYHDKTQRNAGFRNPTSIHDCFHILIRSVPHVSATCNSRHLDQVWGEEYFGYKKNQYYLIINSAEKQGPGIGLKHGQFFKQGKKKSLKTGDLRYPTHLKYGLWITHTHGSAFSVAWPLVPVSQMPVLVMVWSFVGGLCSSSAIVSLVLAEQTRLLLGKGWI